MKVIPGSWIVGSSHSKISALSFFVKIINRFYRKILLDLRQSLERLTVSHPHFQSPTLDIVRTSDRKDSDLYIRRKMKVLNSVIFAC